MNSPAAAAIAEPRLLIDHTVASIERLIVCGELVPGAPLREQALASQLGVSRGPLREAIRTLEGRRLLERTPHAGVRVPLLSRDDVEQLLVTREALEGMACRQAAEHMTGPEIRRLRETAEHIEKLLEDGPGAVFASGPDHDFHRQIAIGSRNRWIERMLCEDLYALLRLYRAYASTAPTSRPRETAKEHHHIIDCIHRRDADAAEDAMRRHVRAGRERLLARLSATGSGST